MKDLTYIFVHGLSGWGAYDKAYRSMPYWGMRGGDLLAYLNKQGFACAAASVSPTGSAWDRACELYAQLAGTRVDYGAAHARKYHHERFGRDYSTCPLISHWEEETRLVLLGHSFGGATIRLFSELLAFGEEEERKADNPSPLFQGGMEKRIHSLITLASPLNGTTAYDLFLDPDFDPTSVRAPWWSGWMARLMSTGTRSRPDGRDERDYAGYDMHIDEALALNARLHTLPEVFYYSVPCSCTSLQPDGTYAPVPGQMEPLFVLRSFQIGSYTGRTRGGFLLDESWRENDGLVNTLSSRFPLGAPHRLLDRSHIEPGIWNELPPIQGDHMWPQGGLTKKHDIRPFYLDLLSMIGAQI